MPPLRHSPTRFGREIFFENLGGKSRLQRRAYEEIREDCAEAVGQEGIKSLIKRAPWVDDMDYPSTRYGARFNLKARGPGQRRRCSYTRENRAESIQRSAIPRSGLSDEAGAINFDS